MFLELFFRSLMVEVKKLQSINTLIYTCLGLAPPRRTSNKVKHKLSLSENLKSLSDIAEKSGCILKPFFFKYSGNDFVFPAAILKNFSPFFPDGRPSKSFPINCKPSNLTASNSLLWRFFSTKNWIKISKIIIFCTKWWLNIVPAHLHS